MDVLKQDSMGLAFKKYLHALGGQRTQIKQSSFPVVLVMQLLLCITAPILWNCSCFTAVVVRASFEVTLERGWRRSCAVSLAVVVPLTSRGPFTTGSPAVVLA